MIIALQNSSGQHLGFILFADDEASDDCVVRPLPKDRELFKTPEFQLLERCKDAGEFNYHFEDARNRLVLIKPPLSLRFERESPKERYAEVDSGLSIFGLPYEPLKKKS